jgi:hypothetical protein
VLADHLGEFGTIRITRAERESTVAWEGERASGTVELEPTKWGTRVRVTARTEREPSPAAVAPEPEPAPAEAASSASSPRRPRFLRFLGRRPAPAPASHLAEPEPEPPVSGDDPGAVAVLFAMLDTLGAAKHRPFSRG